VPSVLSVHREHPHPRAFVDRDRDLHLVDPLAQDPRPARAELVLEPRLRNPRCPGAVGTERLLLQ
jgi:hypothetical protein